MYFGVRQYARQALSSPIEVARALADQISRDRVGGLSAEIAFFALLSFFPTMIVLTGCSDRLTRSLAKAPRRKLKTGSLSS